MTVKNLVDLVMYLRVPITISDTNGKPVGLNREIAGLTIIVEQTPALEEMTMEGTAE